MFVDIKIDEYLSLSPPNVTRCLLQSDRRRVGRGAHPWHQEVTAGLLTGPHKLVTDGGGAVAGH